MAKVLITFLGKSQPKISDQGLPTEKRSYMTADYRFENSDVDLKHSFFAAAMKEHFNIDKIIMIGTVRSMWEEVYYWFSKQKQLYDETVYEDIWKHCEPARHTSELTIPHQDKLEEAMGKDSKVVLVKYGMNEEEIRNNAKTILGIEKNLNKGDELYVDITHSFRSLPLYLMNLLIYLQNVSKKNIRIKNICYGMVEIAAELRYAPVVELKSLIDINEWISGAYSFMEFGDAYKISGLLSEEYNSVKKKLLKFSDVKNLNYIDAIEKQIQEMSGLKSQPLPSVAELVVKPVIEDFLKSFPSGCPASYTQFCLAKWHYTKHNYSSSYITFVESIITYVCEKENLDATKKNNRDEAKRMCLGGDNYGDLKIIYNEVNKVRIQIAHNVRGKIDYREMINLLDKKLSEYEKLVKV